MKVANNLITSINTPIPDCETCGACCVALPCVGVLPENQVASEYYWDITIEGSKGEIIVDRFMRRNGKTFACEQLDGILGEKVSCRIYEQRPTICHKFEAGSDKCHALRRAYGFEPFLSLMEMYFAQQKLKSEPEKYKPSQIIHFVNFIEHIETGNLEIKATLRDNSEKNIHIFDPAKETWRQFQFEGLPLEFVENFINSRKQNSAL